MSDLRGLRALLVDDEADLRILMSEYFRAAGCEVDEASGGIEAIAYLQARAYDFVLSDMRMPKGNGEELANHIRAMTAIKPLLFIYSGFNDLDSEKAAAIGITELFTKPFTLPRMIDTISKHLRTRRAAA